jgi:hypothetical protein
VRELLLRKALAVLWWRAAASYFYRPEKHYMRGPGPKSLSMIGTKLRAQTESITQEPLPEGWLALMHSLRDQEQKRSRLGQAETEPRDAKTPHTAELKVVEISTGDRARKEQVPAMRR